MYKELDDEYKEYRKMFHFIEGVIIKRGFGNYMMEEKRK